MRIWIGRVVSGLAVAMLLFSGVAKVLQGQQVVDTFTGKLHFPASLVLPIGVLELTCTVLYAIPQTAVLGVVLLSGYLGGAMASELRVASPVGYSAAVILVLAWIGLWLREPRLGALFPLRRP